MRWMSLILISGEGTKFQKNGSNVANSLEVRGLTTGRGSCIYWSIEPFSFFFYSSEAKGLFKKSILSSYFSLIFTETTS